MRLLQCGLLVGSLTPAVLSELLGATYPAPTDLTSSNSRIKKAWNTLSTAFDETLKQNNTPSGFEDLAGAEKVTFSASLFSLHDPEAINLQYHYTAPQVANSEFGTKEVDGDSIYRSASVSKLFTVFAGLIELTNAQWNMPLSQIFPELVASGNSTDDPVTSTQWDQITPWALANQLGGLPTIGLPQDDTIVTYNITAAATNETLVDAERQAGLPPLPLDLTVFGPCIDPLFGCTREDFIKTIAMNAPVQSSWTTPGYSNLNYMVLGAVISKFTNKPFDQMYPEAIFEPLSMDSTYVNAPTSGPDFNQRGVVVGYPGVLEGSWAFAENSVAVPSGGILSSINDMNKFGLALANSTLLDPVQTREWMKPHTHTASLTTSIGAPWEIVRYVNPETGKVTDIYMKLGDSGAYGGQVAIIPDYGCGWTMLNAYYETTTNIRSPAALTIINHIAEAIIPALEAQATEEAINNLVGTYIPSDDSINSTLVIGFNNSDVATVLAGLSIDEWISNDVDMIDVHFGGERPYLQPTRSDREDGAAGQLAFRSSIRPQWNTYMAAKLGPFTGFYDANWDVWTYEGDRYGMQPIRSLIFNVDADGYANSVYVPALRMTLKRTESEGTYIVRGLSG